MDGEQFRRRRRIGGRPRMGRMRPAGTRRVDVVPRGIRPVPATPAGASALYDRHVTWQTIRITPRQRWGLLVLASRRGQSVTDLLRPAILELLRSAELLTPDQCQPPPPRGGVDPRLQRKLFPDG